jgi:Zn-dependent protease with chaperone function
VPVKRTALPGDMIGLLVAGGAALLGTACLGVWWCTRIRRRRAAKAAAESPFPLFVAAHPAPPVTALGSAKSLAAARRDVLVTQSSAATPAEPARGADTSVGLFVAEVRRMLAEYGAPPPPAYGVSTGADVNAAASAGSQGVEPG